MFLTLVSFRRARSGLRNHPQDFPPRSGLCSPPPPQKKRKKTRKTTVHTNLIVFLVVFLLVFLSNLQKTDLQKRDKPKKIDPKGNHHVGASNLEKQKKRTPPRKMAVFRLVSLKKPPKRDRPHHFERMAPRVFRREKGAEGRLPGRAGVAGGAGNAARWRGRIDPTVFLFQGSLKDRLLKRSFTGF